MDDQNPFSAPAELGMVHLHGKVPKPSPIASRSERQFSMFIDVGAIAGFFIATCWLIFENGLELSVWIWLISFVFTLSFASLYFYLTEFRTGKSPGKYLARTTVISRNGQTPTRKQFVLRTIARLIPFDSFSSAHIRRDAIFLRDRLSGTVVVADRLWYWGCTNLDE